MILKQREKPSILIVDDEKENLTGFKYLFEDVYEVFIAESAAEGKKILQQHDIQVVISDQRMPKMTGVEFLQEVLKDYPDTIRMILTGYSDFDAIISAINKGQIYYYFSKPWSETEMKMIIENALEAIDLKKQLKQSEECFRQLSENIREVFWLVSTDWKELYYVSSAFRSIFDASEEPLYENPLLWLDSVHPEDLDQVASFVKKTDQNLESELVFPGFRIFKPDDSIRWISFKVFPVKDHNGKTYRIAGLLEDVTEDKQTLETLIQSEKMMSIGGLAAGMAHELNNPLSGIIQGAQLIEQRFSADLEINKTVARETKINLEALNQYLGKRKIHQTLENIKESGLRSSRIISDMLSFSRKSDSSIGDVQIKTVLENIINIARSDYVMEIHYDFKNIKIIKDIEENLPTVPCNETEIGQVILNLLRNAAQAMTATSSKKDPKIIVRAKLVGDNVKIEIEDNGPGMEASVAERVFEPFFTTKIKGEGTGLGLSISYKIITINHKGSISVESKPGQGSIFSILLPCSPSQA
ncbi:response regulator [bacterium]|nr:response regulator [bacterium]